MGLQFQLDKWSIRAAIALLKWRRLFEGYFDGENRWRWSAHFDAWERAGLHVLPVHFYSPVPEVRALKPELWSKNSEIPGLNMNLEGALQSLDSWEAKYKTEFAQLPWDPVDSNHPLCLNNSAYGSGDAEVLYAMVRDLKPRRVIEIGSGFSTFVTGHAIQANQRENPDYRCEFVAIEPYPTAAVKRGVPGLTKLLECQLQEVPLSEFAGLGNGDILFIDSTHVVKIGSDVCYEFLEILPRVGPGTYVHVHDIFLPAQYPEDWFRSARFLWNEQYLLQAFLAFNDRFQVKWPGHLVYLQHRDRLIKAFPHFAKESKSPRAFWMQRKPE